MYCCSIAIYLKPKWILIIYQMQHFTVRPLKIMNHTWTLGIFQVSSFFVSKYISIAQCHVTQDNGRKLFLLVLRASKKWTYRLTHLLRYLLRYERHPGPLKNPEQLSDYMMVGFIFVLAELTGDYSPPRLIQWSMCE